MRCPGFGDDCKRKSNRYIGDRLRGRVPIGRILDGWVDFDSSETTWKAFKKLTLVRLIEYMKCLPKCK